MTATIRCPHCLIENPASDMVSRARLCIGCGQDVSTAINDGGSVDVLIIDDSACDAPAERCGSADDPAWAHIEGAAIAAPHDTSHKTVFMDPLEHRSPRQISLGGHREEDAEGPMSLTAGGVGSGKFRIIEELNRGGMGVILRGRDRGLHREVAIKVIRDQGNERQRARFVEEAQITGQLEHPNIVPVHEFGVDETGRMFFAMKLVRGRNLAEVLEHHRIDPRAADREFPLIKQVGVLVQICNAIAFAHSRGVIHRDLKPSNIMLGDFGEVMLMDWGLAKVGDPGVIGGHAASGPPPQTTDVS